MFMMFLVPQRHLKMRHIWNVRETNLIYACHLRESLDKLGNMYFNNSRNVTLLYKLFVLLEINLKNQCF